MDVDLKVREVLLFAKAVVHLEKLGAEKLLVFPDQRQGKGPLLHAFFIIDGKRHVRSTVERWQGASLEAQAADLAQQLEMFSS